MKLREVIRLSFAALCLIVLLFALCGCSRLAPSRKADSDGIDRAVTNSFWQLWEALLLERTERGERFPTRLSQLVSNNIQPSLFVCPGTGTRPGPLETVDEWTDY